MPTTAMTSDRIGSGGSSYCRLAHLSDDELHASTRHLVGKSNLILAALLAHLAEVESRGIHRAKACSSLYTYCIYELRFSEDAASRRVCASRVVKRFPALLEAVANGELHLTGLLMLGPYFTTQNQPELLARAQFRTKKELAKLVRSLDPLPDVPARIIPLGPAPAPAEKANARPDWNTFAHSLCPPVRELMVGDRPKDWASSPFADDDSARGLADADLTSPSTALARDGMPIIQGTAPTRDGLLGSEGTAPTRDGVPSIKGTAPARDGVLRSEGSAAPTRDGVPVEGTAPTRDGVPSIKGTAPARDGVLRSEGSAAPARDGVPVEGTAPARDGVLGSEGSAAPARDGMSTIEVPVAASERGEVLGALTAPQRYQVQFTASEEHVQLVERAQALLSRGARNGGGLAEIYLLGLRTLIAELEKQKYGAVRTSQRPEFITAEPGPKIADAPTNLEASRPRVRHVPAVERRTVFERDGARCSYVDTRGQRCRETRCLELHHLVPFALDGADSTENLAIYCRAHNALAAEQDFGRGFIEAKRDSIRHESWVVQERT